jgi:hypothetical protein
MCSAAVGVCLASYAICSSAWDLAAVEYPLAVPGNFEPQALSAPDEQGFWAFGSFPQGMLVRYGNDAQVRTVHYVTAPTPTSPTDNYVSSTALFALPDGGALLQLTVYSNDTIGFSCYLQSYDAAGTMRWSLKTGEETGYVVASCNLLDVDRAGHVWIVDYDTPTWRRLAADGSVAATFMPDNPTYALASDPGDGGVYVSTTSGIARYASNGQLVWKTDSTFLVRRIVVGTDGNVTAFGNDTTSVLAAASFTPAGTLRWSRVFADVPSAGVYGATAAPVGGTYLAVEDNVSLGNVRLMAISGDGSPAWPAPFTVAQQYAPYSVIPAVAHNGDALFLYAGYTTNTLYRFRPNGALAFSSPVAGSLTFVDGIPRSLPDDSTVFAEDSAFERFSAQGDAMAPPLVGVVDNAVSFLSETVSEDGSTYVLSVDQDSNAMRIARFGADGSRVWQQTADGLWAAANIILVAGDDRVCLLGLEVDADSGQSNAGVECFGAAGQRIWSATLQESYDGPVVGRILSDGRLVALFYNIHAVLDAQGHILDDRGIDRPDAAHVLDIGGEGTIVLGVDAPSGAFVAIGADGSERYATEYFGALFSRQPFAARVLDDSSAILVMNAASSGTPSPRMHILRVNASGQTLWAQTVDVPGGVPGFAPIASLTTQGTNVFVAIATGTAESIQRIDMATGTSAWTMPLPPRRSNVMAGYHFRQLYADAGGGRLLYVGHGGNKFRLTLFDAASGALLQDRFDGCLADWCIPATATIDDAGALRIMAMAADTTGGVLPRAYAAQHPFATPASIRVDQPGLDGAWYAPYEGGQGFTFDWIDSASTVFMPWFTFIQSGINDPSGLAWYTLQGGGIAPGATSADLAIAVSSAGAFNSGNVPGRQVGTAHLSFSDCNNGTLYYQFDADTNGGAGGLISLIRLTPSTDPCVLADGSIAPPQNASAPANGFDARQSGSWYDTTTGGQGMELTIIPAGDASAGLVFIPWFTFDPAGHSDDALNQHWFTLQGDLSTAANGKVTLPVYRIIGGSFDANPTSNFAQVGHATLTMQGCDSAQLDYTFDSSEVTHAFAGLAGSMHLVKIGGCHP